MAFKTLQVGSKGNVVKALQCIVSVSPDGTFGQKTRDALVNFQFKHGLLADGVAGEKTFKKIVETAPILRVGSCNVYVLAIEYLLTAMNANGVYADDEEAHVKAYQASKGLVIDGVVGRKTWSALFGLDDASTITAGKSIKQPTDYKQYDSRWGNVVYTLNNTYNKKQTIRNSGCGPTSMADIVSTWWEKDVTPKEMAALSVKHGYRTTNSGTAWGFFSFIAKKYNASKFVQTSSFETMKNCLASGGLVVVSFRPSKWTNGG